MKKQQKEVLTKRLNAEAEKLTQEMLLLEVNSKEYLEKWDQLKKVSQMIDELATKKKFELNEKWIPVIGSIASILLIMNHERAHVITTKAFGFIPKGRG